MKLKEVLEDKIIDSLLKKDKQAIDCNDAETDKKTVENENLSPDRLIKKAIPYAKTICVSILESQLEQKDPAYHKKLYDEVLISKGETEINMKDLEQRLPSLRFLRKIKEVYAVLKRDY